MKSKLTYLILSLTLSACSLDIPYDNQYSDPDAITTPETGRELLASAYSSLPNLGYDLAIMTDDFVPTYWASRNPSLYNQYNWQPSALHDLAISVWPQYYSVIATVNALDERLPGIVCENDADRRAVANLRAESATLKAYCYFQLLRLFASDPADGLDKDGIILKNLVEMQNLPRSTVGESIDEIRRLLESALTIGNTGTDRSWMTNDATTLLLAQLELYAGNNERAARLAMSLIDSRGYTVFAPADYRQMWEGMTSAEQIFFYNDPEQAQSYYIGIVYDTVTGDYFSVDPTMAASFAEGDCRTEWSICPFYSAGLGHQSFIGKYNRLRREKQEINFINKLRLAQAVFVAAEAYCLTGTDDLKAIEVVNSLLEQRGAEKINSGLRGKALLAEILAQKHKEFVGEGERYFDIKHYRKTALRDMPSRIPASGDYRWLWPIPKDEYLYNDNVNQNDGWPRDSFDD